jgi:hypothetical protein
LAVLSLFVLRAREPQAARPFRAWLYPVRPRCMSLSAPRFWSTGCFAIRGRPAPAR